MYKYSKRHANYLLSSIKDLMIYNSDGLHSLEIIEKCKEYNEICNNNPRLKHRFRIHFVNNGICYV